MKPRLLLFDLDGTLLRNDKTISQRTLRALGACRQEGMIIAVVTSRGETNALSILEALRPDAVISSAGALVRVHGQIVHRVEFSAAETMEIIGVIRSICGTDCQITVDTVQHHYWNTHMDVSTWDATWGESLYHDFAPFEWPSLKICFETADATLADQIAVACPGCDCLRFSDGNWYKLTPKEVTKENAILRLCEALAIPLAETAAFGDDYADIGMLRLCGIGVAMGNAIPEVKAVADVVIGSNQEDGIAVYLEQWMAEEGPLELYIPTIEELWFRQQMMADPTTMAYNAHWNVTYEGYHPDTGCIDFPREQWADWYADWIGREPERFYAYIRRKSDGDWIGEVNVHLNPEMDWYDMGIVIHAPYRGQGYAVPALKLLLDYAFQVCKANRVHNDFELSRKEIAAWKAHFSAGFQAVRREKGMLDLMITREQWLEIQN